MCRNKIPTYMDVGKPALQEHLAGRPTWMYRQSKPLPHEPLELVRQLIVVDQLSMTRDQQCRTIRRDLRKQPVAIGASILHQEELEGRADRKTRPHTQEPQGEAHRITREMRKIEKSVAHDPRASVRVPNREPHLAIAKIGRL